MAKSKAAHMLILCILLGASHFARECTACQKHQHGTSTNDEAADCAETEVADANSDQEEEDATADDAMADDARQGTEEPEKDLQSDVESKDTDNEVSLPTTDSPLRGTEELDEDLKLNVKFTDTDDEVPSPVHPAIFHHSVQSALPVLIKTENFYKELLRLIVTRAFLDPKTRTDVIQVVRSLVHLIVALKAIRTYIENVRSAWVHLKETVHHLVQDEKLSRGKVKSVASTLKSEDGGDSESSANVQLSARL